MMPRRNLIAALVIALGILRGSLQGAQTAEISTLARSHLAEIITVFQRAWLHRAAMDWGSLSQRVFERAGAAQTIPDTYDAIRLALTLLGDKHSYYVTASGQYIFNPESPTQSTGQCTPVPVAVPAIPADVGYVRIQMTTSPEAIQEALRNGDRAGTIGWIVDLRGSGAGNTWPALAGIGSLLGDGTAGFFVDAVNRPTPWGYTNGMAWLQTPRQDLAFLEMPYRLRMPGPRVAVLTDIGIAGPGEALAIAFRARENTRSFGTPTCGLSAAVAQIPLSRGARLGVVTSVMADRTMKKYGGAVDPDELVANPLEVVPHALAWLHRP
ncbi:MAG: S41 family peptidase [Vicinamibacterales bacterium]